MICDRWDVVVVPFPFVDNKQSKPRPVLVLSKKSFNSRNAHTIMAMITTGGGTSWSNDVLIKDLDKCGLKSSSLIRSKLFTLDNRFISKKIGKLSKKDISIIKKSLKEILF